MSNLAGDSLVLVIFDDSDQQEHFWMGKFDHGVMISAKEAQRVALNLGIIPEVSPQDIGNKIWSFQPQSSHLEENPLLAQAAFLILMLKNMVEK